LTIRGYRRIVDAYAMNALPTGTVVAVAIVALAATLGASEVLVRGVGRLARNLGLLGGVVGLIIALGADSPEISSSVSAVASGSAAAAAGVVFGSNIFNIAFLLGGAALATGELRIHRSLVVVDAGVAIVVTIAIGLAVLGEIPIAVGWILMLLVFIPYVAFLVLSPRTIAQMPLPRYVGALLANASRDAGAEGKEIEAELEGLGAASGRRSWLPVALMIPALGVIVLGALALVLSAVTLGERWGVASVLVGVIALAAATSLPNVYAAVRLAIDGRGAAVVSATFNSNTLNLVAGVAIPILLFPSLRGSIPGGDILWLLAMSFAGLGPSCAGSPPRRSSAAPRDVCGVCRLCAVHPLESGSPRSARRPDHGHVDIPNASAVVSSREGAEGDRGRRRTQCRPTISAAVISFARVSPQFIRRPRGWLGI
jgi:cation:H+ antiporter